MVIIVLVLTSFCFFRVKTVHATDWLSGWDYRKSHVMNNSTGAGTNYQVKIVVINGSGSDSGNTVYLDNKARSDFGDIRFTDNDQETELDYWMEELHSGDNATFWLEVTDDLSSSDATIYIYYGKADATYPYGADQTEMDATFIFADHFYGDTLDGAKWSDSGAGITVGASEVTIAGANWIRSINTYNQLLAFHGKSKTSADGSRQIIITDIGYTNYVIFYRYTSVAGFTWGTVKATVAYGAVFGTKDTNYHKYEIRRINDTLVIFYFDGGLIVRYENPTHIPTINLYFELSRWLAGNLVSDYIFVRKAVDPAPVHSDWGTEETAPPTQPSDAPVIGPFGPSLHRIVVNVKLNDDWVKECNVTLEGGPDNRTEWGLTNLFGRSEFRVKTGSYEIGLKYEDYTRTIPLHVSKNVVLGIELTEDDYVVESFMEWTPETMLILVPAILVIVYALKRVADSPNRKWKYSYLK